MKWHSKSEMSSNPCCLIWGKIWFWQAILDNKDHTVHGKDWCGKWWREEMQLLTSRSKTKFNSWAPSGVFPQYFSPHLSEQYFPYMSKCCFLYILAMQVYGKLINMLPNFWERMGGSLQRLISTRTDMKNVHIMFRTHGSDQVFDLHVTCNH